MRTVLFLLTVTLLWPSISPAQNRTLHYLDPDMPFFLMDRGYGVPTSMFGTYNEKGELLIYPFFEYYRDNDMEYKPSEFGYGLDQDFRGRYRASEGLIFLGYGFTENFSAELEIAVIRATLNRAADDSSSMPTELSESGLGDVQTQFNYQWMRESADRPGLFSYAEVVYPLTKDKVLIGTADWEFKVGTGIIRGYRWGTLTGRLAIEYSREENKGELGEIAIEYLRVLTPSWRLYLGVEGVQDEWEMITEMQWHISRHAAVKLNSAFGLSSKATDWAPEIGIIFRP